MRMTEINANELPPCLIHIDKEGRWYHEGREIIHREIVRLFYQNMELDPQGRYVINWKDQRCWVDVEDTAFVVRRVVYEKGNQVNKSQYVLHLSDDTKEMLLPNTLYVGQHNVLYCKVKSLAFPARFDRAAYYQLAQYVEQEGDTYYLPLNRKNYKLSVTE
jgi:hypothetical protein